MIVFIDFKKVFDSIVRTKMLKVLLAYMGFPLQMVGAIKVMCENTSGLMIIPEGKTDLFPILTLECFKVIHWLHSYS